MRIRPALAAAGAVVTVAALVSGASAAPRSRTTTASYSEPVYAVAAASNVTACVVTQGGDCPARAAALAGERFVSVKVDDTTGTTVSGVVSQDVDGDGQGDFSQPFCGATDAPVSIAPGHDVLVWVFAGGSPDCPGAGTQGTITFTFSKRK